MALRTHGVTFHPATRLLAGDWSATHTLELDTLNEPQAEAVAFGGGGALYLGGAGAPKSSAGTFARFTCAGMW